MHKQRHLDPITASERKAEEYKQTWTPSYDAACRQESFFVDAIEFRVEVIQEINNPKIACRFLSLDTAKAFRESLLKEEICRQKTPVFADHSYRQRSDFRGKTVYTLNLTQDNYEELLAFQISSFTIDDEDTSEENTIELSSEIDSGYLTTLEENSEEEDSEEEKKPQASNPSLAIYQNFGGTSATQESIKPKALVSRETEEEPEVTNTLSEVGEKQETEKSLVLKLS